MIKLPLVSMSDAYKLQTVLENFPSIKQISTEKRLDFSGDFPVHTRYFKNGDRPLVALIKLSGYARLSYNKNDLEIPDNSFVFFDDSIPHSWCFMRANLEIHYYRFVDAHCPAPTHGDYCLDNYF